MLCLLAALTVVAALDGQAAHDHAAALAALGPHAWGSPRSGVAANYVFEQFRAAGLQEVRRETFQAGGAHGINVVGVLRAPGPEFVVVGAHHDTVPGSPGAYDDGSGVGILIETARVFAEHGTRSRTLVFVSFDGKEETGGGLAPAAGARAFIEALGDESRQLVAALIIEMSGWQDGRPVVHPIPYPDPWGQGKYVVTPAWLMRTVLAGSRRAGGELGVGDPLLSWLYQPAVRTFRVGMYGDDRAFARAGLPAVFVSDSSFRSFYPWYHTPADSIENVSAEALEHMGRGVVGAVDALERAPRGPPVQPTWFAAFGQVFPGELLLVLGALSLAPGLLGALVRGNLVLGARFVQAGLFGWLMWRHPLPALAVFLFPNLFTGLAMRRLSWLSLAPAAGMIGMGVAAWQHGLLRGLWVAPWELSAAGLALALLWLRPPGKRLSRKRRRSSSR